MAFERKAVVFGNAVLALFDFGIGEFFDYAAIGANEMIVVVAVIELEHGFAAIELAAHQNAGLLELRQNAIHRSQTNIHIFGDERAINIFGTLVTKVGLAENVKNLQARERRLQTHVFQFVLVVHS